MEAWRVIQASACGTSHLAAGVGCQDYCRWTTIGAERGSVLIAVCSDGAGSARLGGLGAQVACQSVADFFKSPEADGREFNVELALLAVKGVRNRLQGMELNGERELHDYRATLLLAVAMQNATLFLQIGDGAIVYREPSSTEYELAFAPDRGEYINETHFLTDDDWQDRCQVILISEPISDLAMITDGLESIALSAADLRVHQSFFAPIFGELRGMSESPALLEDRMRSFLESPRVCDKTDDDKTLLIAVRAEDARLATEPA